MLKKAKRFRYIKINNYVFIKAELRNKRYFLFVIKYDFKLVKRSSNI